MRVRETTHRPGALVRLAVIAAGAVVAFLATLSFAQPAQAQVVPCPVSPTVDCRPICVVDEPDFPAGDLTATIAGPGSGVLQASAKNPYKGATDNDNKGTDECATGTSPMPPPWTWEVKRWCGFHCEHWHTLVDPGKLGGGTPYPATAIVTAVPDVGSYFLGWAAGNCTTPQKPADPRLGCAVFMDADKSVTANLSTTPDNTAPSAPEIAKGTVKQFSIQITWPTPGTDETWLGGYEVYRNDVLYGRRGASVPGITATGLLCNTSYTWKVRSFDGANESVDSNILVIKSGACAKVPPNTVLHVKPPLRTSSRVAYFHWGAKRNGIELGHFKSQCRKGKYNPWRKCFPGKTYRNLRAGYHTVRIRVGDAQGWDRTPVKYTWFVRK
jgi:hypothetical protein